MSVTTGSGYPFLGDLPWGSHICHFYEQPEDLAELLVPFFRTGLTNGERCLWVTDHPLRAREAIAALRRDVDDLDQRMAFGQIDIVDAENWYRPSGHFEPEIVIQKWIDRTENALADGFTGLRATGNTFWLETSTDYRDFAQYEAQVNERFRGHPIICVCSYCMEKARGSDVVDVVRNHQFAVARRAGDWQIMENATLKTAKEELAKANALLESRIQDRTRDLEMALTDLQRSLAEKDVLLREVHHRVKNNLQVINSLLMLKSRSFGTHQLRQAFDDVLIRISAMGLVHETLYQQDDTCDIDFGQYLRSLATRMVESMTTEGRISIDVAADSAHLDLNTAVPVGLIAAEVIANAMKHAFPGDRSGRVSIDFRTTADGRLLTITDDGIGIGQQPSDSHGVGLRLLNALVRQVGGNATFENANGTVFRLQFKA